MRIPTFFFFIITSIQLVPKSIKYGTISKLYNHYDWHLYFKRFKGKKTGNLLPFFISIGDENKAEKLFHQNHLFQECLIAGI